MEGVPSPLRVGSPAVARKASVDDVPATLRAGSPMVGDARPPLTRKNTSGGSDRLAQLFPSRPPSVAAVSPIESPLQPGSRRTSYPSPLVPASGPAYRIPSAPAPPSFSDEDTSYNPTPLGSPGAQSSPAPIGGRQRFINRLASLRHARTKGAEYNRLEDESGPRSRRLGGLAEEDEYVGYDVSALDGGLPMRQLNTPQDTSVVDSLEQQRDLHEAGYAAEYERLEAQLGAGMNSIMEMPFTHHSTNVDRPPHRSHKRDSSRAQIDDAVVEGALKEAEKTGGIVAVSDFPVDISGMAGDSNDFETRSVLTTGRGDNNDTQTSYFFPPDPDMPSWRPWTLGWPWLSFLVLIALVLAGLQEFLCQLSMRRVREDPETGGLLQFVKASELSVLAYFLWKYAPILFFVIYGILWQMTDFEVKRLEPYYQLSRTQGATAAESLNMDYLTFLSWLVPLRALRHKQYAVIYVSIATLVASSLVPVLQSASVETYPPRKQRDAYNIKAIRIDPPWSRAVTVSLVLVACCGCVLIYAMRRKSGLLSNPNGIAGIAAMATRSHILADFHGLDIAPLEKIHKQLRNRRYILHKSSLWQGEYIRNNQEKVPDTGSDPRPLMLRLRAGVPYICYVIIFTAVLPIFLFVEGLEVVTEKLPFFLTALATIIKLLWNTMNCDVRMLEPFYILSRRRAPAKTLTMDYTGTNPLWLPFKAAMDRRWLVALVALGSILAEVLTVCVSSFSVDGRKYMRGHSGNDEHDGDDEDDRANQEQTFNSFWLSLGSAIIILIFLIIVACVVYVRRSHKFMPRQIGTMASVLAFIHQSKMLVNFVDTDKMTTAQMTKHLEKLGKTYALGWFSGRDGDDHCGIDEEPILAQYKYGVDWTKTRMLGHQIGTWEQY